MYCISQRAEHIWEGVSSATTRSRPIINTRDEPHADAERYRRLHVIVGDSNMSEYATFLKVGATSILLRMLEDPSRRAARHDAREPDPGHPRDQPRHHLPPQGAARQRPRASAPSTSRREYLDRALRYAETQGLSARSSSRRSRCGSTASPRSRTTRSSSTASVDWVIKYQLIEAYRDQARPAAQPPEGRAARPAVPRRQPRARPLLPAAGPRAWSSGCAPTPTSTTPSTTPPQTTRARLRGEFIQRAKERKRDYTVDWVHLKLNDQAQRTVLCKDPFKCRDERVEKLIASL